VPRRRPALSVFMVPHLRFTLHPIELLIPIK
jgi:hypothetical protein